MKQRVPHEFLRPLLAEYKECIYCAERKSLVCLICGFCYECHPAIEEMERFSFAKVPFATVEDIEAAPA
jgi:hypothetical protein